MLKSIFQYILKSLASSIIKKYRPDVIGITGSIGKTSAKEAIAVVLAARFNVRSSFKNYNNEIGVPLTIIGINESPGKSIYKWLNIFFVAVKLLVYKDKDFPEMLVLEMGSDKPGDIAYLLEIAPCKVGVLTYIAHAHTEKFKTIKKIAQEKRLIVSRLQVDDFAVFNFDNDIVMENVKTKAEMVTYGFREGADFQASKASIMIDPDNGWPAGLNFKVDFEGSSVPIFLPGIIAEHFVLSALAGISVGHIFGINLVEAASALRKFVPIPGHMRLINGIKKTMIIDDTYNSSPDPTRSALKALANINIKDGAKRYAILGDMLELGVETENLHREVGLFAAGLGIDIVITIGEAGKYTAKAAREAGMDENKVISFSDSASAGRFVQDLIKEGDIILVKGSRGIKAEKIVKEIMAEPLLASSLLVG